MAEKVTTARKLAQRERCRCEVAFQTRDGGGGAAVIGKARSPTVDNRRSDRVEMMPRFHRGQRTSTPSPRRPLLTQLLRNLIDSEQMMIDANLRNVDRKSADVKVPGSKPANADIGRGQNSE